MKNINEVKFSDTDIGSKTKRDMVDKLKKDYEESGFTGEPNMSYLRRAFKLGELCMANKEAVEELAHNIINAEYGEIIEMLKISLNIELVGDTDIKKVSKELPLTPGDSSSDLYKESHNFNFDDEVEKRKLLNIITQGASKNIHRIIHKYKKEIFKIDSAIFFDTDYVLKNNEYFELYTYMKDRQSPSMIQNFAVAYNKVTYLKESEYKGVEIEIRGADLGLLLHEGVKGIFEAFTHIALPAKREDAIKVLLETDTLEDEMEDLVLGVYVYRKLVDFVTAHKDIDKIDSDQPFLYVYGKLVSEDTQVFKNFMNSLLVEEGGDNMAFATKWLNITVSGLVEVFEDYKRSVEEYERNKREEAPEEYNTEASFDPSELSDSELYSVKYYKSISEPNLQILMNYLIDKGEYEAASLVEMELNSRD